MTLGDLGPDKRLEWLEGYFVDPAVPLDVIAEAMAIYNDSSAPDRGAAGFLLLKLELEKLKAQPAEDHKLYRLLADSAVESRYRAFYKIEPEYPITGASVHDIGTTSVILRCHGPDRDDFALKCVLPKYANLRSVMEQTDSYDDKCKEIRDALPGAVPKVFHSNPRSIAMRFVDAKPLHWLIDELDRSEARGDDRWELRLQLVERLLPILCSFLHALSSREKPLHHLDLSPGNILVELDSIDDIPRLGVEHVTLIDFGFNYLLTDIATRDSRAERALTFIAPELGDQGVEQHDPRLCDVYSLGALALEILTPHALDRSRIRESMKELWERNTGLAALVEDLLDRNPEHRLLRCAPEARNEPFEYLGDAIKLETEIAASFVRRTRRVDADTPLFTKVLYKSGLVELWNMLRPKPFALKNLEQVRAVLGDRERLAKELDHRPSKRTVDRLTLWLRAHEIAWGLALFLGVALSVAELGNASDWIGVLPDPVLDFFTAQGIVGEPSEHLAARIVALTTALLAYAYYTTIFAPLAVLDVPLGRHARILETSARVCCLAAILAQIVWLFIPLPPAIIGGAAGVLIGVNNLLFLKFLVDRSDANTRPGGQGSERLFSTVGDDYDDFVVWFGPWWWLMGIYSVVGAAIGVLLLVGLLEDLWAYAILMAFGVNYLKLFLLNVARDGPRLQSYLARSSELLIRADRLRKVS